ncbi:MAG TPA: murein biosynthesis integral membrane protein MurJ [Candidatus Aquicultor sp.]|jgi:putative peptidoglycan lipid II flippase
MQNEDAIAAAKGQTVAQNKTDKAPSLAKSTAKMSVATTFSRLTGFMRNMALAFALGGAVLSDTFFTANVMPNIIFELLMGGVLGSVIIPVYVQYLQDKSDDETRFMISNLTNIIFILAAALSLIGAIFSPFFVHLMTLREPARETPLMIMFFRVFAFQIMFYAITAVFSGVLNSHRKFTMPMAAPILNNLVVIATVFGLYLPLVGSNPDLALLLLAIGTTTGVIAMALVQIPSVIKAGLPFRPALNFRHPAVKQVAKLGLPMLGFAATVQLNNYIIYMLLQSYTSGATGYMQALAFFQLPYAIFAVSITTAIFPELSRFANSNDFTSFKRTLSMGLRSTSFIVIPSAVYLAIMAQPIIALTLQHGKFDASATATTASMLTAFAFALLSFSLYNMLTRIYYSLQDTKTPLIIGAISVPMQVAFNFLFVGWLGASGLPLSYALALTFAVVAQLYVLRHKIGTIGARAILTAMGKHIVAAIPTGFVIFLVYDGIGGLGMPQFITWLLEIVLAAGLGGVTYLGVALLLGVKEVDFIRKISRRVLRARVNPT